MHVQVAHLSTSRTSSEESIETRHTSLISLKARYSSLRLARAGSPSRSLSLQRGIQSTVRWPKLVPRSRTHGTTLPLSRSWHKLGTWQPGREYSGFYMHTGAHFRQLFCVRLYAKVNTARVNHKKVSVYIIMNRTLNKPYHIILLVGLCLSTILNKWQCICTLEHTLDFYSVSGCMPR